MTKTSTEHALDRAFAKITPYIDNGKMAGAAITGLRAYVDSIVHYQGRRSQRQAKTIRVLKRRLDAAV